MSDNQPTNVQLESNNGMVSFATDVIATIAGLAATEVEGVCSMYSSSGGFADIFTRRGSAGTKGLTKGVKVDISDNRLSIAVNIIVDYGFPVPEIAKNIQENVKKAVENMSGLTVQSVNVHVQGVSFEREMKAAAEIEEQQRLLLKKQAAEEPAHEAAAEQTAAEPVPAAPAQEEVPPQQAEPEADSEASAQQSAEPAPAEQTAGQEEDGDEFVLELEDDDEPEAEPAQEEPAAQPAEPAEGETNK